MVAFGSSNKGPDPTNLKRRFCRREYYTVHKKILFLRNRKVGKIQVIKISVVSNMEKKIQKFNNNKSVNL